MNKKERTEELLRYLKEIRDDEGYAVVDVNLQDGAPLYNPLSMEQDRKLSDDIYHYIDAQTNVIPAKIPLRIRFHGDVPEEEQERIRNVMVRHYMDKSRDVSWDLAANFRKILILVLIGVAVLALYFYFSFTSDQIFLTEILSIVGTFALWEAADAVLLERPQLREQLKNIEQNLNQRVEFVSPDPAAK